VVDLSRFKLKLPPGWAGGNAPFGWRAEYDKGQKRWTLRTADRPAGVSARLYVDQLPADLPKDPDAYAAKLREAGAQDPGRKYMEVSEKGKLPDGFFVKGLVQEVPGKGAGGGAPSGGRGPGAVT
jgi:hypothetical protein